MRKRSLLFLSLLVPAFLKSSADVPSLWLSKKTLSKESFFGRPREALVRCSHLA